MDEAFFGMRLDLDDLLYQANALRWVGVSSSPYTDLSMASRIEVYLVMARFGIDHFANRRYMIVCREYWSEKFEIC